MLYSILVSQKNSQMDQLKPFAIFVLNSPEMHICINKQIPGYSLLLWILALWKLIGTLSLFIVIGSWRAFFHFPNHSRDQLGVKICARMSVIIHKIPARTWVPLI